MQHMTQKKRRRRNIRLFKAAYYLGLTSFILCGAQAQAQLKDPFTRAQTNAASVDATQLNPNATLNDAQTFKTQGVLKAKQTAELSGAIGANITQMPYRQGQSFKRGALLVEFDCKRERAEAEALRHAAESLSIKYDNIKELHAAGAAGELEENMAGADKARAAADYKVAFARLSDCAIHAPYAGTIKTRYVNIYDSPPPGAPILSIIRTAKPEITFIAPSSWLRWMKAETPFDFAVDETGQSYSAKIIRLGAAVDPVSQTIEVTARFTQDPKGALAGMSGVASFASPAQNSDPL